MSDLDAPRLPTADHGGAHIEGINVERVSAWFADNIPGATDPLNFRLIAGGRSNLTFEVDDAAGQRWVLRRPPTGHLLPTAHDMVREHHLISAVGPAGVPVPAALGLCQDPAVNGAPFYVMGFVDGHILRTPEQVEAAFDLSTRQAASASLVDTLVRLHQVDVDAAGLGDLARREGYIARQLKRWYAQYQASRDDHGGPDIPDIDATHALLQATIPEQGPATIVHGDYRLDNAVIGDDGAVRAVLDWELCTLGDPLADLGQLIAYWAQPGDDGSALADAPTFAEGFFTRQELAARYGETSGRDLSDLDFYVAFSFWKLACIIEGVYTRYIGGAMGDDGADVAGFRTSIDWLAASARQRTEAL
jgi:aminoglycoside phosphotransferase (APT) family kinase protein